MLFRHVREGVELLIRYGCFAIMVRDGGRRYDQQVRIVDPLDWYPVRAGEDWRVGDEDLIVQRWNSTALLGVTDDRLTVWRFMRDEATVERTVYELLGENLGAAVERTTQAAGMPGVSVVRRGLGEYGVSDFPFLADAAAELRRRYSDLSEALGENLYPHLAVPEGSLDPLGTDFARRGAVIPVPERGNQPQYIVWAPAIDAIEADINRAWDEVYRLAGIAGVLVDRHQLGRADLSGAALDHLARVTISKILDIRDSLDEPCRESLTALVALRTGVRVEPERVSIVWPAPLEAYKNLVFDTDLAVRGGLMARATGIQRVNRVAASEAGRIASEWLQEQLMLNASKGREPFGGMQA